MSLLRPMILPGQNGQLLTFAKTSVPLLKLFLLANSLENSGGSASLLLFSSTSGVVTEEGLVRGGKSSSAKTNGGTWTWADLGTDKPGGLRGWLSAKSSNSSPIWVSLTMFMEVWYREWRPAAGRGVFCHDPNLSGGFLFLGVRIMAITDNTTLLHLMAWMHCISLIKLWVSFWR